MRLFPQTKEARWRLALLPFIAYPFAVVFVVLISLHISRRLGWDDLGTSWYGAHRILEEERTRRYILLEYGNGICIFALLLGAALAPERRRRRLALAFTVVVLILAVLFYPATLPPPKTRSMSEPNQRPALDAVTVVSSQFGSQRPDASETGCSAK